MSATKVAPPNILMSIFVIASEHNVRARQTTVCEARIIEDSMPFDCFALLAMTIADSLKIHFSFLSSRGTGGLLAKRPPYPP